MSPERPDLVLTADIPNSEADIFIFHCLHIETCTEDIEVDSFGYISAHY